MRRPRRRVRQPVGALAARGREEQPARPPDGRQPGRPARADVHRRRAAPPAGRAGPGRHRRRPLRLGPRAERRLRLALRPRGRPPVTDGSRSGVVLVTPEPVAERMAGPAIRALELARALARDGRSGPVSLVSLTAVERQDPRVTLVAAAAAELRRRVARAATVIIQGDVLGLHPWLAAEPMPIVVDAYDPYHLEQLEQARPLGEARRRAVVRDCVRSLNTQL